MEDADLPPEDLTPGMDVNMDNNSPLPPGFVRRNPNVIDLDSDTGNDSDSTLLGDEIVPRAIRRRYRQVRNHATSFRELQTHTQNNVTFRVGRTFHDPDGKFFRVTSIKQYHRSGRIAIESFQDNSHRTLQTHSYGGRTLRPGKTVEVADGTFLRIKTILEDRQTGEIFLKGFPFRRTRSLDGLLESKRNEVALIMKSDILEKSTEVIGLATVVRIRTLVKTNQQFPALSYRETEPRNINLLKEDIEIHCQLVCRWKYYQVSKNEGFLKRLTDLESDEGCSLPQAELRTGFRGRTIKGGISPGWLDEEIKLEAVEWMRTRTIDPLGFHRPSPLANQANERYHKRRYTFFDGFSGGGGASRGAQGAGLRVERGLEQDPDSVATYNLNFPHAKCEAKSAYDFFVSSDEEYKTDVLHVSPPCPTFSPLHTRPGANDESNEAAFLATEMLLKKTKPRIVTLEETFGLTALVANLPWFRAMIQMFTKLGFSIRWKVFNLLDFGLPQPRRRLFLYASW